MIGADGHNSIVRAHILPHHPHATYAGYMGWIASMSEEDLPKDLRMAIKLQDQSVEMFESSNGFKLGSIIEREVVFTRVGELVHDTTISTVIYFVSLVA